MEIKNLVQQYIYWPEVNNQYQKNVDFSHIKISELKDLFDEEISGSSMSVEKSIINFYALNEILAKLRVQENEVLDKDALTLYKAYVEEIEQTSKKLYAYIFFITLMEARHCHDLQSIRNPMSLLEGEDYDTRREYGRKLRESLIPLTNKNENKRIKKIQTVSEKYGDLEYEYDNENYQVYAKEREEINRHYYKVQEKIQKYINRKVDIYAQQLSESRKERLVEFTEKLTSEAVKRFVGEDGKKLVSNRRGMEDFQGEEITKDIFNKFLILNEKLGNISGYNRSGVYDTIIPIFEDEEFKSLTIEDLLKCVVNVFTYGKFSSSYGGIPWAKITAHSLNFTRGNINAEVFVDQAFSLEHNNGNMFNKGIIFSNPESYYWRTYVAPENISENETSYYNQINNCQFLLNAQHQGQLLSLLNFDVKKLDNQIGSTYIHEDFEQLTKSGLIPKHYTKSILAGLDYAINENLQSLKGLTESVKTREKIFNAETSEYKRVGADLTEFIERYKIEVPELDLYAIINGCKLEGGTFTLDEKHRTFHNLTVYQLNKYVKPKKIVEELVNDYSFDFTYLNTNEIPQDKMRKELLGNKAFGLAKMHEMDLPVPQAIVFPTSNANSFFNEKAKWLRFLRPQLKEIQNKFIDNEGNPISCSVRSGSSISMPGMMDTILNVGIDDSNYDYFCEKMGKKVTNECITKFMKLFTKSLFNEDIHFSGTFNKALYQFREVLNRNNVPQNYEGQFPLNARQQYKWCLQAVFSSWHSERANAYRAHHGISNNIGTAAIVQQMVFGNLNDKSCTGVVFSRDCISGEKGIIGEFLPKAQGEDVVSGAVTPLNIKHLEKFNPVVYDELMTICERLEKDTGDIQDIEFTVEDGTLYILQKRKAVCSAIAQTKLNKELFDSNLITREQMLDSINVESLMAKDIINASMEKPEIKGLVGNPGILRGIVIHNESDMITYAKEYEENKRDKNFGWIFYAPETSPEHAPIMLKTQGFITSNGGFTSHAAILARSWDKPCVVGVGNTDHTLLQPGSVITMDANNGHLYSSILPVKKGSKAEINNVVNEILDYYQIDIGDLVDEKLNQEITEINDKKSWMEEYSTVKVIENKVKIIKIDKFLDLGYKVALMLVKAKEDSQNPTSINMGKMKSSLDKVIEEAQQKSFTKKQYSFKM